MREACFYSEKSLWSLIRDITISLRDHMFPLWWVMCARVSDKESNTVVVPPASYRLRWEQSGGAWLCLCATVTGCDGWSLGISALEVLNERSRAITLFLCMCHESTPIYESHFAFLLALPLCRCVCVSYKGHWIYPWTKYKLHKMDDKIIKPLMY